MKFISLLSTILCFSLSSFTQAQVEAGWYQVRESSDTQYWSKQQNIQIVFIKADTILLQGMANYGGTAKAKLSDGKIDIPLQFYKVIPFGGNDTRDLIIEMKGEGTLKYGILNLKYFFKWEDLSEFKEINIEAKHYLPEQKGVQRVSDTVLDGRYFQYVLYSLNKRPTQIGEIYLNGIKNGLWYTYDQQGLLATKNEYLNDTVHGWSESYYHYNSQGDRKIEGVYYHGVAIGEFKNYEETKRGQWQLQGSEVYDAQGRKFIHRIYHKNGQIAFETYYDEFGKEVWYKSYSKKGTLIKNDAVPPPIVLEIYKTE